MCALAQIALLCAVACGEDVTAPGTAAVGDTHVTETDAGTPFDAKDAISTQMRGSGFGFHGDATYVEITESTGTCDHWTAGCCMPGRELILAFAVMDAAGNGSPPTAPGTFVVSDTGQPHPPSSNAAEAFLDVCGAHVTSRLYGLRGTVDVTSIGSGGAGPAGAFDVTLTCGLPPCPPGSEHRFTGSFASTTCSSLNVNHTVPACM